LVTEPDRRRVEDPAALGGAGVDPVIRVADLVRTYRSRPAGRFRRRAGDEVYAVRGISFEVRRGEVFGLLGPNGAGKTTTLETLEGLLPLQAGTVTVLGLDVARHAQEVRSRIGIQLQKVGFFDKLHLVELLELLADFYEVDVDPLALLAQVGLRGRAQREAKRLSGGELQRFSIAAALVNRPELLFLDEPTSGLDPHARRRLWELIRTLDASGISIVLTTHYIEEAEALCHRVAIMDNGVIAAQGTPRELIDRYAPGKDLEEVFLTLTGHDILGRTE
jgi:ABC-2 type transport system ATP-binding protein